MTSETTPTVAPGDLLRIERRYVVDGVLTCVTDEGRFVGLERIGSAEHLVLAGTGKGKAKGKGRGKGAGKGTKAEVRLFPLHAIAEIKLLKAGKRAPASAQPVQPAPAAAWDPSVA